MRLGLGKLSLTHVQQAGGGGGDETPAWLEQYLGPNDEVPFAVSDFANGQFWLDGAEVAIGDLFATDVFYGDWDPNQVIPSSGLLFSGTPNYASFVPAVAAQMLAPGFSAVTQFTIGTGTFDEMVVRTSNAVDFDTEIKTLEDGSGLVTCRLEHTGFGPLTHHQTQGVFQHREAVTCLRTSITASMDGTAVTTASFDDQALTKVALSIAGGDSGHVKFLSIFVPALDNADLPTMSAVPPEGAPENTVAPVISGTPVIDQTLSCTTGTWTGDAPISYTYQWLADGNVIAEATDDELLLSGNEEFYMITCRVTATNAVWVATALSNELGPVTAE